MWAFRPYRGLSASKSLEVAQESQLYQEFPMILCVLKYEQHWVKSHPRVILSPVSTGIISMGLGQTDLGSNSFPELQHCSLFPYFHLSPSLISFRYLLGCPLCGEATWQLYMNQKLTPTLTVQILLSLFSFLHSTHHLICYIYVLFICYCLFLHSLLQCMLH